MEQEKLTGMATDWIREFKHASENRGIEEDMMMIPFRRVMKDPSAAVLSFRALVNTFKFGDYFHGLNPRIELTDPDKIVFQDFIQRCSELAQFDPLWSSHSVSIYVNNEEDIDNTDFSIMSEAEMRDLCLLFRKVYSDTEPGGNYKTAMATLQRIIRQGNQLEAETVNSEFLLPISTAHKTLKVRPFDYCWKKEILNHPDHVLNSDIYGYTPEKLTSILFYGHYIHKDKQREEFEKIIEDPKIFQHIRFRFIQQINAQTLVYLTFAEFILTIARGNGLKRPLNRDQHQTKFRF